MAELEIQPERRQFVGQTPSLPTQAPVQEQIQKSAEQVNETVRRASVLLSAIARQKQNSVDAQALLDLKKQKVNLDEQALSIDDPQKKMEFLTNGLNNIWEQIQKNSPNISSNTKRQVQDQIYNDHYQHFVQMTNEAHKQAIQDIAKKYDETKALASTSTNYQEQIALEYNFFDYIDKQRDAGLLTPDDVDDYKVKLKKEINEERLAALAADNPDAVLMMKPSEAVDKYGVLPSKLLAAQTQAASIIANGHDLALAQFRRQKNENLIYAWFHPKEAAAMARNGQITLDDASQITGTKVEQRPPQPELVSHLINQIDHIRAENRDSVDDQINTLLKHYSGTFNENDMSQINRAVSDKRADVHDDLSYHRQDTIDNVSEYSNSAWDSNTALKYGDSKTTKPVRDQITAIIHKTKTIARKAESQEELDKIQENSNKQIDEIINKPLFGGTSSTKPGATTSTPIPSSSEDLRSEVIPPPTTPSASATPTPTASPVESPEDKEARDASQALVNNMYRRYLSEGFTPEQAVKRIRDYFSGHTISEPTPSEAPADTTKP